MEHCVRTTASCSFSSSKCSSAAVIGRGWRNGIPACSVCAKTGLWCMAGEAAMTWDGRREFEVDGGCDMRARC